MVLHHLRKRKNIVEKVEKHHYESMDLKVQINVLLSRRNSKKHVLNITEY